VSIILPNCKKIFLPDEGYKFFNIDFSGADAMIVVWESECDYLMRFFTTSKEKLYIHLAREYLQKEVTTADLFYGKMKKFIHLCLTGDHEVLTPSGWVTLQNYTDKDKIMVWDKNTTKLHFEVPVKMTKSFVSAMEPLVKITGENFEQICTLDHKLPYKNLGNLYEEGVKEKPWFAQTAKDLPKHVVHPLGGIYDEVPEEKFWPIESICGFIEVQACIDLYGQISINGEQSFCLKETEKTKALIDKFKSYAWLSHRLYAKKSRKTGDIRVYHWFTVKNFYKKADLPIFWLLEYPLQALQTYINTIKTIKGEKISLSKKETLVTVQLAFHLQNEGLTYTKHKSGRYFVLHFHEFYANSATLKKDFVIHAGTEVFCPTTSTGFFLIRKNSKISVTGNTNYGGAKEKAAASSGLSPKVADGLQKWYFKICPEIPDWQQKIAAQVKKYGYIENIFGARFYLLDTTSKTLLNQAYSLIPQSTIAIAINKGFVNIFKNENPKNIQVLMQVYDALAGQFLIEDTTAPERIKKHLEIPLPYKTPLIIPTDLSMSDRSYGEC